MKIEYGIMLIKEGRGWGVLYKDNYCTTFGWVRMDDALIFNPDLVGSDIESIVTDRCQIDEMKTGSLLYVERHIDTTLVMGHTA